MSENNTSEHKLSDDLAAVEASLAALPPFPSGIDRDRLVYLAGQAAAGALPGTKRRPAGWLWPMATAASLLVAAALGAMLAVRSQPEIVERLVVVRQPAEPVAPAPVAAHPAVETPLARSRPSRPPAEYLRLRDLVLSRGVDALPETSAKHRPGPVWRSSDRKQIERLLGS